MSPKPHSFIELTDNDKKKLFILSYLRGRGKETINGLAGYFKCGSGKINRAVQFLEFIGCVETGIERMGSKRIRYVWITDKGKEIYDYYDKTGRYAEVKK